MTRKVLSNTRSIVILRRIFLLLFQSSAGNRRKHVPAVTRIKQKFIKCLSTDWLVFFVAPLLSQIQLILVRCYENTVKCK